MIPFVATKSASKRFLLMQRGYGHRASVVLLSVLLLLFAGISFRVIFFPIVFSAVVDDTFRFLRAKTVLAEDNAQLFSEGSSSEGSFSEESLAPSEESLGAPASEPVADTDLFEELKVFTDVLAIVQKDYVKPVPNKKLVEGAIKGMLTTLDPHSGYFDKEFYQDLQIQTKGEFGGLGIEITFKDGLLVVVAPMEGSPAERAGVRAGDAIIKIAGEFTKQFTLVDAVKRLRGPKGTPVMLSVMRKGAPDLIDLSVMRDNITVKSVRGRSLGGGYGYARVSQFVEKTEMELEDIIKKLKRDSDTGDLRGLILDLRNNPGGLLAQAVKVSDLFLEDGVIVYTDGRLENQKQKFFAHPRGTEPNYPMIVLVNGGSASASEIVAGALKDHGRALVLGSQTFGKGSVQTITPLENGGAVTLTTALYYTKSGRSIQALGVKPDIEMEATPERPVPVPQAQNNSGNKDRDFIRESDLPGAIRNPTEKDRPGNLLQQINQTPQGKGDLIQVDPDKVDLATLLSKDAQLARAIDLLKSFTIFKRDEATG